MNPYAASAFYAVDRYASYKKVWGEYYERGGLILTDRYTTSNAVHQTVKCPPQERGTFSGGWTTLSTPSWACPGPTWSSIWTCPPHQAVALLRRREADTHTQADIHEVDTGYLAACRDCALQAARLLGWKVIPCVDAEGTLRPVEDIHGRSGPWRHRSAVTPAPAVHAEIIRRFSMVYLFSGPRL